MPSSFGCRTPQEQPCTSSASSEDGDQEDVLEIDHLGKDILLPHTPDHRSLQEAPGSLVHHQPLFVDLVVDQVVASQHLDQKSNWPQL